MGKLILKASPTFVKAVQIHVPGGEPMSVDFEFKHKTRRELKDFLAGKDGRSDVDALMEVIHGWPGQDVDFSRENLVQILENYHGSGPAIMVAYITELQAARLGN